MDNFDDILMGTSVDNDQSDLQEKLKEAEQKVAQLESENTTLKGQLESAFNASGASSDGRPMLVDINDVIEDPDKPNTRQQTDEEFEQWLTENIKSQFEDGQDGVQDPISVRWSEDYKKWIINKGHTRRKCAEKAGLTQVPVIIQDKQTDWNQVIENIIRKGLSTKDMVKFIMDKKTEGIKQTEIAKRLSRDKGWVSKHVALANPPQFIQSIWDNGYATDFTVLYGLVSAFKKSPELAESEILKLVSDKQNISQDDINKLNKSIANPKSTPEEDNEELEDQEEQQQEPAKKKKAVFKVAVKYDDQEMTLLIQKPSEPQNLVLEMANGELIEAPANEVSLLGINEE